MNNCLEVDIEGLAELQSNKKKTFIINELIQNAWDEDIKECKINMKYHEQGEVHLSVEDDCPEGFKDIRDAYTLFKHTDKRFNPEQRGRFNLGEKQVIAFCLSKKNNGWVRISTTKGTFVFEKGERTDTGHKRKEGSVISLKFRATEEDYEELLKHAKQLLIPSKIKYIVNGEIIKPKPVFKSFEAKLLTDILKGEILKVHLRETTVNLVSHNDGQSWIYEMGIPIMKTDCPWHIDVQQKVQLNIDRNNILPSYVQDLYAEVLNNVYDDVEEPSALWVRNAMKDKRITKKAVKGIMNKRFGDKYCIANPLDPKAMGEAISRGFRPIFGGQMSAEEWSIIKDKTNIESATQLFGDKDFALAEVIEPNMNQKIMALYAKKIAKRILGIKVNVKFVNADGTNTIADYDRESKILRFNVAHPYLKNGFFDKPTDEKPTKLIIHELSHEDGGHIDYDYQEMQSTIGAKLTMITRKEPKFHEVS